ncbi:MAG: ATP-binding protein [bacterium]
MNDLKKSKFQPIKNQLNGQESGEIYFSSVPVRLVALMALLIFLTETLVMFLLFILPPLSPVTEMFIDSLMLVGLIAPSLYYVLFKPLVQHIEERRKVEQKLERASERQQKLNNLKESLLASSDLKEKLSAVTQTAIDAFQADFCRVWIIKPGDLCDSGCLHTEASEEEHICRHRDMCLHLTASSERYNHIDGKEHGRVPFGCYKIGQVAAGKEKKFLTNDITRDPSIHNHKWDRELGLVSFAGYRLLSPDGKPIGVLALFSKQPITNDEDALLESLANTTAQVLHSEATKEALQESERNNRLIVDTALDAVITINAQGFVTNWGGRAEAVFGWSGSEILGRYLDETIVPPPSRQAHREGLKRFRETGQGVMFNRRIETTAIHKDGHEFPVELSISSPIQAGKEIRFTAFVHDITKRKQFQERLEDIAEELKRSNQELEDFASIASHDLQEPLRKVQAFGSRLQSRFGGQLGKDGGEYLERMLKATKRMQTLITDLLTFSLVAKHPLPFASIDLNEVILKIISDLEVPIKETGTQIVVKELPTVEAEPFQMRQLFQNLISNAIKYRLKEGAPTINICGKLIKGEPKSCEILVKDNGIGFDEKYLDRIFEIFQRLHSREEYDGTGIGLAICRKITDHHGGTIAATGVPGKGATFTVTLPLKQLKGEADT